MQPDREPEQPLLVDAAIKFTCRTVDYVTCLTLGDTEAHCSLQDTPEPLIQPGSNRLTERGGTELAKILKPGHDGEPEHRPEGLPVP